ncbi:hypothetical protein [Sulfuricurvum sp.]|uniref:hypothetical protein n=1 Tax=Sulfuricurvum sp. TaxID=2025608 RepID=UPI002D701418|nr:hypothetical protein [Sulfuricurvum sp.]HZF69981.1 hypothetical protein [Sulfuricurvum sp.]
MKYLKDVFLYSIFILLLNSALSESYADVLEVSKPIFDTTRYLNKPKSNESFFIPMTIIYEKKLLPHGPDIIDKNYLRALAFSLPKSSIPYILDIESWKCGRKENDVQASNSIDKYILVIDTMKQARPDLKFGYFGIIPVKAPLTINTHSEQQMRDWKHALERSKRLVSHVDVICPEGYTYLDDKIIWLRYMEALINEAKTYGKPIYPFLWPEFMEGRSLKGRFIARDFWKVQLDYVYTRCDGVIIWGGRDFSVVPAVSREWDEKAPWWIDTKLYIQKNTLQ